MSDIIIEGQENLPESPALFIVNRADLAVAQELEKLLGAAKIAWLVVRGLLPDADVMSHFSAQKAQGLLVDLDRMSPQVIADRIHDHLNGGRHVVLVTGRGAQANGSLADAPARILGLADGSTLPAIPVYVGRANGDIENPLPSTSPCDRLTLRILPRQRAGARLGSRVRGAWMEADAAHLSAHPLLAGVSLPRLLLDSLMRHPDARLIDGVDDSSLSYRDLLVLACVLAGRLRRQTRDARLGIILPPGKYAAIANLACLLAGISPYNVNYTLSKQDFARQRRLAGVNRCVTDERFMQKEPGFSWPRQRDLLFVDRELREAGRAPFTLYRALVRLKWRELLIARLGLGEPAPQAEAALLFTGGAEDKPKGVPLGHAMLVASVIQLRSRLDLPAGSRVLSSLPLFLPAGYVHGLLLPLLTGCDMVTYPSPRAAKRLATLARQRGVSLATATPGTAYGLLRHGMAEEEHAAPEQPREQPQEQPPPLRYLVTCGGTPTKQLVQGALTHSGVFMSVGYGLTEATSLVALNLSATECGPTPNGAPPSLSVVPAGCAGTAGAPLPGIAVRVTDVAREGRSLPPDASGIVWVKGANVMPAYLGAKAPVLSGGWLRTGDIGSLDADGMLTVYGRRAHFSFKDGMMMPHEQIEAMLAKALKVQPDVPRLAVVDIPDPTLGARLVLLSTVHNSRAPGNLHKLRYDVMNEFHSSDWVPTELVLVEKIPLLPNGRIDRPACRRLAFVAMKISLPDDEESDG